jgi:Pyruvate/2-oxoacid:ferredoxin oxidoreductase delta subunit
MPDLRAPFSAEEGRLRALAAAVEAPGFIVPWLDRFYEPAEIDLVLRVAAGEDLDDQPGDRLHRAWRRAVLDRDEQAGWSAATFHYRYELWALYEHWRDVPTDVRTLLNEWQLQVYLDDVGAGIRALRDGRPDESDQADYAYLLLDEAEALVREQEHIYLWPCNCRAMWGNCTKSHAVCLRFDNDRDIGWEISPERAVEILRQADHEGLMRTAYLNSRHGHHGICNCCSDCCFPILAGEHLDAAHLWPVRRYVAAVEAFVCARCRRCVKRCPFGAITLDREGQTPTIDPGLCRGCGVCTTGCEHGVLVMKLRADVPGAEVPAVEAPGRVSGAEPAGDVR